jgi:hypothetical protein
MPSQVIPVNEAVFSATESTNKIVFSVSGSAGVEYITQAATNLITPDWISLATNTAPFSFIDTNTASFGTRYYRAIDAQ